MGRGERGSRGTSVTLKVTDDGKGIFSNRWRIEEIVRKFSDFIEHPVVLAGGEDGDKELKQPQGYLAASPERGSRRTSTPSSTST